LEDDTVELRTCRQARGGQTRMKDDYSSAVYSPWADPGMQITRAGTSATKEFSATSIVTTVLDGLRSVNVPPVVRCSRCHSWFRVRFDQASLNQSLQRGSPV